MNCSNFSNSEVCGGNIAEERSIVHSLFPMANQMAAETLLSEIFNITLSISSQCNDDATAFFCKATYQTCDRNRTDLFPTPNECVQLRDNTCRDKWERIQNIAPTLACCNLYNPNSTCPDQFGKFCGICAPLCSEFSQYGEATTVAIDVIFGISTILGNLTFGVIVFVTAFLKRRTM